MGTYEQNAYNKVKRGANRASYDHATVHEILDAAFLCHLAYVWEGRPIVIPTAYGREGETIYVHGAVANRMIKGLLAAEQASLTVTHLDGLVLARSGFHHSANYRSVSVFGKVRKLESPEEKIHSLKVLMDHMLPGRWEECRPPSTKELKGTLAVAIDIEFATAKVRAGGPIDDEEDYDSPYWAGQIPMSLQSHPAISDELLQKPIPIPPSVIDHLNKDHA
jgi:nitroimidazol reductase NimA-like FMN-containing flavoprotein (pyridoxamine 5'-phosphate oxidase superfamily)